MKQRTRESILLLISFGWMAVSASLHAGPKDIVPELKPNESLELAITRCATSAAHLRGRDWESMRADFLEMERKAIHLQTGTYLHVLVRSRFHTTSELPFDFWLEMHKQGTEVNLVEVSFRNEVGKQSFRELRKRLDGQSTLVSRVLSFPAVIETSDQFPFVESLEFNCRERPSTDTLLKQFDLWATVELCKEEKLRYARLSFSAVLEVRVNPKDGTSVPNFRKSGRPDAIEEAGGVRAFYPRGSDIAP